MAKEEFARKLVVEFRDLKLLDDWKKLVIKKYHIHGAIKLRIQELVEKDLKTLKEELSDGSTS